MAEFSDTYPCGQKLIQDEQQRPLQLEFLCRTLQGVDFEYLYICLSSFWTKSRYLFMGIMLFASVWRHSGTCSTSPLFV